MSTPDAKLIQRCRSGDQNAWGEMVDRYGRLVYSIPRRYGLSESDSDDVFAAVWAAVFRTLGQLRDESRLSSWLITMAHRETWRVSRRKPRNAEFDEQFADLSSPSEDQVDTWEQQHLVRRGLDELGGRCKDLLTALFLEPSGPDYGAIASRLDMPVGSIGPTRARCFKKLEKILVRLGFSDEKVVGQGQESV